MKQSHDALATLRYTVFCVFLPCSDSSNKNWIINSEVRAIWFYLAGVFQITSDISLYWCHIHKLKTSISKWLPGKRRWGPTFTVNPPLYIYRKGDLVKTPVPSPHLRPERFPLKSQDSVLILRWTPLKSFKNVCSTKLVSSSNFTHPAGMGQPSEVWRVSEIFF